MKKDTRTFLITMFTIPALLASAAGVHAFVVPSTNELATEPVEAAVEPGIIEVAEPAPPAPAVPVKKPVVTPKPTPVVVTPTPVVTTPTPTPVVTTPAPTPVKRVVVRTRRTSAS